MNNGVFVDIATWASRQASKVFKFWVYNKMAKPSNLSDEFITQHYFENNGEAQLGYIREVIDLGLGEYLIGFELVVNIYGEVEDETSLVYYKLSEIHLAYDENDVIMPIDES